MGRKIPPLGAKPPHPTKALPYKNHLPYSKKEIIAKNEEFLHGIGRFFFCVEYFS
jgi:hypothetical protein